MLRYYIFILICCSPILMWAQSVQQLEENLTKATNKEEQLNLSYQLAETYLNQGNEDKAIEYSEKAIELAKSVGDNALVVSSYLLNGKAYYRDRNYRRADDKFENGLAYAKSYGEIELAIESYLELIETTKKLKNTSKATRLAEESLLYLKENSNYKKLKNREVDSRNRVVKIDQERAVLEQQKVQLEREINKLRSSETKLSVDNSRLSEQNTTLNQRQKELAEEKAAVEEQVDEQKEAIEKMSATKARIELLSARQKILLDSLDNKRQLDSLHIESQTMSLQNAELQLSQSRYLAIAGIVLLVLLAFLARIFYLRYKTKKTANELLEQKNKTIAEERERSDELLLNILPANIAEELKNTGKAKARKYSEVTVMFTDFRNFTKMSEVLTPEQLVNEIDECFKAFDMIISQYPDIEKIKTIGDAYMCASGFSERKTVPDGIVQAALEIQEYLEDVKKEKRSKGLPYFEARIGLHSGPVVAGVVGSKKFSYDIWGDTVNTAARMEQKCEVGQVNISQTTYGLIKYQFDCQYRGRIEAKNKGMVDMYYVLKKVGKPKAVSY